MARFCWCLLGVVILLAVGRPSGAAHPELRAGVARIDLTPSLDMKASLGGYGERMSHPAEGIHDRVLAKALVLTDGTQRLALVTADILGFPPQFKGTVVAALQEGNWTTDQIILLPSHSHTSIDMMQIHPGNHLPIPQLGLFHEQLYKQTVARISDVIRTAAKELTPVCVGTQMEMLSGWNANRRHADGPVDRQLVVTRIDTPTGKPFAVLVNWTAHPTFMSAEDMWYSGGWPGHLQRTLESLIGAGVCVMYYNGAEGDQRPIARPDSGDSHWERAERYGRDLAIEAKRVFDTIEPRANVELQAKRIPIVLPPRAVHSQFMATGGSEYGVTEKLAGQLLGTILPTHTHGTHIRIGDLMIVGVPGELTAELGMQIKRRISASTGVRCVTIGGLADEWISYILSEAEYRQGGYEASVSFYGPTLGRTIVDALSDGR